MYSIPSHFFPLDKKDRIPSCFVFPYANRQSLERSKIFMEMHVISFLLEGGKQVVLADRTVSYQPSHFLMLKQGKCLMTERHSLAGQFRSLLLFVDNSWLQQFCHKYQLVLPPAPTEQAFALFPKTPLLDAIAHSLEPYFQMAGELSPEVAHLKTEELLWQVVQQHGPEALAFLLQEPSTRREIAFQQVIEQHITSKLTVAELAFLCHMSPSTFRRRFLAQFGQPPGQWLTAKRLEQAAQLLQDKDQPVSDVYLSVGFESLSSFIQSFKQQYGLTPKQYQQQG